MVNRFWLKLHLRCKSIMELETEYKLRPRSQMSISRSTFVSVKMTWQAPARTSSSAFCDSLSAIVSSRWMLLMRTLTLEDEVAKIFTTWLPLIRVSYVFRQSSDKDLQWKDSKEILRFKNKNYRGKIMQIKVSQMRSWLWRSSNKDWLRKDWHLRLSSEHATQVTRSLYLLRGLEACWQTSISNWAKVRSHDLFWYLMKIWKAILLLKNSKMDYRPTTVLVNLTTTLTARMFKSALNTKQSSSSSVSWKKWISHTKNCSEAVTSTTIRTWIFENWRLCYQVWAQSSTRRTHKLSTAFWILIRTINAQSRSSSPNLRMENVYSPHTRSALQVSRLYPVGWAIELVVWMSSFRDIANHLHELKAKDSPPSWLTNWIRRTSSLLVSLPWLTHKGPILSSSALFWTH